MAKFAVLLPQGSGYERLLLTETVMNNVNGILLLFGSMATFEIEGNYSGTLAPIKWRRFSIFINSL